MVKMSVETDLVFIAVLYACFIPSTVTFNLAISAEHRETITSPSVVSQKIKVPKMTLHRPLAVMSAYFGYSLSLQPEKSENGSFARLIIGAPGETPQDRFQNTRGDDEPRGGIYTCDITDDSFFSDENMKKSCQKAHPPARQPGDRFGSNVAVNPDGTMTACSSTRSKNCTFAIYLPGFCYKSSDYGKTWTQDRRSRNQACNEDTVDVIFVLDGSKSVQGHFHTIKNFVKNITSMIDLEKGSVRVGVVQYSTFIYRSSRTNRNYMKTEIELGRFKNHREFQAAMENITLSNGGTMTGAALRKVMEDFSQSERYSFPSNKQLMILLTDGQSNYPLKVEEFAGKLRGLGVIPYAVGVGNKTDYNELKVIANSSERIFQVDNFEGLSGIVGKLQSKILSFQLEASHAGGNASFDLQLGEIGFSSWYGTDSESLTTTHTIPEGVAADAESRKRHHVCIQRMVECGVILRMVNCDSKIETVWMK